MAGQAWYATICRGRMMVKIVNTLGEVKTGVQGEAVYQGRYGQQIRRTRQPKRAIPSQKQLEHRQLYREALTWRKALSLPNRRYLDGYCLANWIVDDYKIALPWSRFALKLYLQHIGFVMVEKPIMVYLPAYEDFVEEQTKDDKYIGCDRNGRDYIGQRLTIPNRKVIKLAFKLFKVGSPSGDITLEILRVSDDSIILSKYLCDQSELTPTKTDYEVTFITPAIIDEEVRMVAHIPHGDYTNYAAIAISSTDEKANEVCTFGMPTNWAPSTGQDAAYRYTYRVGEEGEPSPDYENSTKGLLHVKHPALLSGEHRRDGKLLEEWTNLSNLDDEYLTGQVGVDVFSGDELKFATIAGVEYAFRVP